MPCYSLDSYFILARTQLAVLDHNSGINRNQATTKIGTPRVKQQGRRSVILDGAVIFKRECGDRMEQSERRRANRGESSWGSGGGGGVSPPGEVQKHSETLGNGIFST